MSQTIDLSKHGKELKKAYDAIVANDPSISWAVFNYEVQANTLSPYSQGADDLQEFVDEFDDGKVQYGFARVIDPNNNLPKFVLVGWAGEGIPERVKGYFNGHFATISKYFHGYHVQITARSQDDLAVRSILSKVDSASGAKYSSGLKSSTVRTRPTYSVSSSGANDDDWGDDAPPVVESEVTKVQTSYRPTKVDIAAIKSSAPKSSQFAATPAEPVKGSYQPVGKVDIAAIRSQAKDDRFNPKPSPLQSSYKPVGKVDIAAIKAQAAKKPSTYSSEPKSSTPQPLHDDEDEDSAPKSVSDRMKAFGGNAASSGMDDEDEAPKSLKDRLNKYESNSERLTSLPKPKVNNKVAGRFGAASSSSGTVPPLPGNSFGDSKKTVGGASRDFGSQGGKTPAQLWAEKHAKKSGATPSAPRAHTPEPVETPEAASVSSLRSNFASTTLSSPEKEQSNKFEIEEKEEEEEESTTQVSDLKSKFAQKFAASKSPEPEFTPGPEEKKEPLSSFSSPPPAAERSLPPPLPSADRPVPVPEPAQTTSQFPPPPTRSLPPAFVPPAAALQKQEEEEEEEEPAAVAPPPTLPSRSEPEPSATEPSGDGVPAEAVVLFDYVKDDDNELNLTENEKITILDFSHDEWWLGKNSKGEEGLFPAEYVQVLKKPYAIALYDYEATEDNELTFPEGAYITEITFDDEDWWKGVYMKNHNLFPRNYVELQE